MSFLRASLKLKHTLPKTGSSLIDISEEVLAALNQNKPVVALESTIITHGLPSPHNFDTAVAVEGIIRDQVGKWTESTQWIYSIRETTKKLWFI